MVPVTVRAADAEDAAFVARIVFSALEGHLADGLISIRLPSLTRDQRINVVRGALLNEAGVEPDTHIAFELERFIIAEVNGVPAGAMVPYGDKEYDTDAAWVLWDRRLLSVIAARHGDAIAAHAAAAGPLINSGWELIREPSGFHTEFIGVDERFRGRGVLPALFAHAFAMGRAQGYTRAILACFTDNRRAVSAYLKNGFTLLLSFEYPSIQQLVSMRGFSIMARPL